MEKLQMCRLCLAENVRMFVLVNRNLHVLYEKLTDIPFVTEDSRPILACFFCCAKLKQCYRLLRQCLEAEELFSQIMNEDYEPNPLTNQDHLEVFSGFIKSPIEHISIDSKCQTECFAVKEELPAVCEELDNIIEPKEEHDIIEPKEEHQSDELAPEHLDNSCLEVADLPPHHSASDLGHDVPLMEFKTEVDEEQEVSKKKRRARKTKRATVAKKPKLETRRTKPEDATTAEQTIKDKSDSIGVGTTQRSTSIPGIYFKEPLKSDLFSFNPVKKRIQHTCTQIGEKSHKCDVCQLTFGQKSTLTMHTRTHTGDKLYKCNVCQRSFNRNRSLRQHIRIHSGEKPYKCDICQRRFSHKTHLIEHIRIHTGEKPYRCDVCQRSFSQKSNLTKHKHLHTGEKPYKCDVCQRSFNQKSHLTIHNRTHTGDKPYKCNVCQRSFNRNYSLTLHIRIHSGEKPYKCDVCQRSFSQKYHLTKHMNLNTCEKPY